MVKAGSITPKGKQNVKGEQKKGQKKAGMEISEPMNAGVKGSGKRKHVEEVVKVEGGKKKVKIENNSEGNGIISSPKVNVGGKNPKQKENILKDITPAVQTPEGGKKKKNKKKKGKTGEGNATEATTENKVAVKEEIKANGITSPAIKTEGKNAKKKKNQMNGEVKSEVNGIASPKVGGKKGKKKNKKPKGDDAQKGEEKENKVVPQGNKSPLNDLPYKENERMTMYENSWIKKDAVEKLEELKISLKEEGLGKEEIAKKVKKAKAKYHHQLRRELVREKKSQTQGSKSQGSQTQGKQKQGKQKQGKQDSPKNQKVKFIIEDGKRYKVLGNGRVIQWENVEFEENERSTKYDNVWVKKEDVGKLDELKASLEAKGFEQKKINLHMLKAKRKSHKQLERELREAQCQGDKKKNKGGVQMSESGDMYLTNAEGQRLKVMRDGSKVPLINLPFEENERMTKYDNLWVKKEAVSMLDEKKEALQNDGLPEKVIKLKMRKELAKAHKRLKMILVRELKASKKEPKGEVANKPSPAKEVKREKKQKGGANEEEVTEDKTSKQEVIGKKKQKTLKKEPEGEVANKPSPAKEMKGEKKQKGGANEEELSEDKTIKQEVIGKKKQKKKKGKMAGN